MVLAAAVAWSFPQAASTVVGDTINKVWVWLITNCSQKCLFVNGISLLFLGSFWGMSLLFAALDFLHGPTLAPFKVQANKPLSPTDWAKHIPLVLVNHVVLYICLLGVWEIYRFVIHNLSVSCFRFVVSHS